jgi:hypothetical protein
MRKVRTLKAPESHSMAASVTNMFAACADPVSFRQREQ